MRKQSHYTDTTWWDPDVEKITDEATYLRRKFRQDVTDPSTGLNREGLSKEISRLIREGEAAGEVWRLTKAKGLDYCLRHQAIDVSPLDWFPAIAVWNRRKFPLRGVFFERKNADQEIGIPQAVSDENERGNAEGDWRMWIDTDHSVPDWHVIIKLGFAGMRQRLDKYCVRDDPFYEGLRLVSDGTLAALDRFVAQGEKNLKDATLSVERRNRLEKEIACFRRLRSGAPQTAYDVLMFIFLYFLDSEHLDAIQCRCLSQIDQEIHPYYQADLAAGRTTEAEFRSQLRHWLWQWGSIANYWNQPVGIGGTLPDGSSGYNDTTRIILEVMDECALPTPKFLVKVAKNTPDWALDKMMDLARRHRSIAFLGEESIARALRKWEKATEEECRLAALSGCYEFAMADSCNGTGSAHINFLKPIERMLSEAKETDVTWGHSYEGFLEEYCRRLADVTVRARKIAFELEKATPIIASSMMMTLATENALREHKDGFTNGCAHGNHTALLAVGVGTAVDALLAIKDLVFVRRDLSLSELGKLMAANWEGREDLRLRMLRSKRKWGNNDAEANALGGRLITLFAAQLNGVPNSRGGTFRASGHSARQYIEIGEKTGATPDGRKAGEEMSKNLSATMGPIPRAPRRLS